MKAKKPAPAPKRKARTKPALRDLYIHTGVLHAPEVIVRIKRRVGPMLWHAVVPVLEALHDACARGLNEPDPYAKGEDHEQG